MSDTIHDLTAPTMEARVFQPNQVSASGNRNRNRNRNRSRRQWLASMCGVATAAVAIFSTSCSPAPKGSATATPAKEGQLKVVATTTMLADMVRQVGGDTVHVHCLMEPGVDPHQFKPEPSDIASLQSATIIFHNGLMLEGQLGEVLAKIAKSGRKVVAVGDLLPKDRILGGDEGHPDPHVWGDASLWKLCAAPVAATLAEIDAANAASYQANATKLTTALDALHTWAKERAASVPEANRILITSHDAFEYFGRAYGFQVVGIQGISTVTEAGSADIVKAVDFIREKRVKALFVESSVPKAVIERISQDAGAKIAGELFSDAMGIPGDKRTVGGETYDLGTYEGMLKHNVNTVVEALR